MNKLSLSLLLCISLPSMSSAAELFSGKWIDLTHAYSEETIYWPTSQEFTKTTVFEGRTQAGFYYTAYNFCSAEHGGTHVDAPIHFYEQRQTVDQIPVEQLIGPGVVIRIHEQVEQNRGYQLSLLDILDWEKQHGAIEDGAILLIDTGLGKHWPDRIAYMGTDKRGQEGVESLKFPGIHPEVANFLTTRRSIKAVGIDTPSIDFGGSTLFETHQILFKSNIPGLENVANLDKLPVKGSTIIGLPMKIKGGSGSPIRIVAHVPEE